MIQLNYPEMLQEIKTGIFIGDHSAIYSMACGIACIAAAFSLLTWYNKMMNDPFGRLDVRAVIRAVGILFLTCNFYSFVLVPLDGITYLVTKGITASVDADRDGVMGKINDLYASVEEHDRRETLSGQFAEELERETSATDDVEGFSYKSSSAMEALMEEKIERGERPGFFKRVWNTVNGMVNQTMGMVLENAGNILSAVISILVKLVQYVFLAVSSVYLMILGLMGPFVFAFALIPGFQGNIQQWLARYIQISFWLPITAMIDMINIKIKGSMIPALWSAAFIEKFAFPVHLIVMDLVTLICLLAVPSLASWVIQSGGAADVNRNLASAAQKASMLVGKLK